MERIEFKLLVSLIGLMLVLTGATSVDFFPLAGVVTMLAGAAMVVTVWL